MICEHTVLSVILFYTPQKEETCASYRNTLMYILIEDEVRHMQNVRYDVQALPDDPSEVRLIYCTMAKYDVSWHSIMHRHPHAELFLCLDGHSEMQIARERVRLHHGDLFLINPGVEHTEYSDPDDPLSYIVIGMSGVHFIPEDGSTNPQRYCCTHSEDNLSEYEPYFLDMIRELSARKEGYLSVCLNIMNILLAKASRCMRMEIASNSAPSETRSCDEIKQLIDEHFTKPITLEWLAAQAHISKFHLSHLFRQQYGVSPIQYLNQRRLQEAEYLLTHTTHSLSEIGTMIGFSSASYFSQAFKHHTGMSPSAYRSKQQPSR